MFRTARGFLLAAPPAFVAALVSILVFYSGLAADFSPYPFLTSAFGKGLAQSPLSRFAITSGFFFLLPYVTTGVLLFFADAGVTYASRLWRGETVAPAARPAARRIVPEARWTFAVLAVLLPLTCGYVLVRFARRGELPGGVNIAPLFVAAYPFLTTAVALVAAFLVGIPRSVYRWAGGSPRIKKETPATHATPSSGTQ